MLNTNHRNFLTAITLGVALVSGLISTSATAEDMLAEIDAEAPQTHTPSNSVVREAAAEVEEKGFFAKKAEAIAKWSKALVGFRDVDLESITPEELEAYGALNENDLVELSDETLSALKIQIADEKSEALELMEESKEALEKLDRIDANFERGVYISASLSVGMGVLGYVMLKGTSGKGGQVIREADDAPALSMIRVGGISTSVVTPTVGLSYLIVNRQNAEGVRDLIESNYRLAVARTKSVAKNEALISAALKER